MKRIVSQAMERLVIGRKDYGEVQFLQAVDVSGLDFDPIIEIDKGRIQLYGNERIPAPALGSALNVPAMLTFRWVMPIQQHFIWAWYCIEVDSEARCMY